MSSLRNRIHHRLSVFAFALFGLAACGDDGAAPGAPGAPDVAGVYYYGTSSAGAATCAPTVPPGYPTDPQSGPVLDSVSQSGAQLSLRNVAATTPRLTGSIDAAGAGVVTGRWEYDVDATTHAATAESLSVQFSGNSRLTSSGQIVDEVRPIPGGELIGTCTRSVSHDLARRTEPVPEATPRACSEEATLRPQGSETVLIVLINTTGEPVNLYALDESGARVPIGAIAAGDRTGRRGTGRVPVVVTDAAGQCLVVFVTSPRAVDRDDRLASRRARKAKMGRPVLLHEAPRAGVTV